MFNSFLDGTKSAIEMAAVANATGLVPQDEGLLFPPVDVDDLATALRPRDAGGVLSRTGTVEVVSSLHRDGRPVARDLRWGVYVSFSARTDYAARCFAEYGVRTDPAAPALRSTGRATYRPRTEHRRRLGGAAGRGDRLTRAFAGDVVSVAKRDLRPGELLDGEGGYTVRGALAPAAASLARRALPIGLAAGVTLRGPVAAGSVLTYGDVTVDESVTAVRLRRRLEGYALAPGRA